MKIDVGLNPKSIKKAKNQLLEIKKLFSQNIIIKAFLEECKKYLMTRMDFYLNQSGIGSTVISNIMKSWSVNIIGNKCTLVNNDDKAVFVEFGVGIVGQSNPHPFAYISDYEYNVESDAKDEDGEWNFFVNENNLDLPKSAIEFKAKADNDKVMVFTRGTKGVWYAYNALQDLRMNAGTIWKETVERVIG